MHMNQSDYFTCESQCKGEVARLPSSMQTLPAWYKGNEQNGEQKGVTRKEEEILRPPRGVGSF